MEDPAAEVPAYLVADKYRLSRLLGRGGMGAVWEGVHSTLGTRVAVKFIEAEYAGSAEARSRFDNEARAAARLRSKHVVQVYDHGVMPDGRPYIVMEFLAGEPLDARLDRVGRLTPADTASIILQVCRALATAHQVGIVHRDLKPENVFLVWDDDDRADIVKVVDFGIAKFTDASLGVSSATRTGSVLGTPYFMSPEQARGLRTVDYRSDLWSVGIIAYRCVVGRLPFEGEAMGDLLVKICTAPIPVPSQNADGIPTSFDAWFGRAVARDPAARFSSATELAEELCAAVGLHVRGEIPSSMLQQPGLPASAYAATQATNGVGAGQGYPARAMASQGSYQTPAQVTKGHQTPPAHGAGHPAAVPAALTGAPTTRPMHTAHRSAPLGALLGAGVVGLLVLTIGVVAVIKFVAGASGETAADSYVDAEPSAAGPAASLPSAGAVEQSAVEPEAAASVEATPAGQADAGLAPPPDAGAPERAATARVTRSAPAYKPPPSRPPPAATKPEPPRAKSKPPAPRPRRVDVGY
jgi:tRNA A-37 threonylcarbamoyl transferase component Bud32